MVNRNILLQATVGRVTVRRFTFRYSLRYPMMRRVDVISGAYAWCLSLEVARCRPHRYSRSPALTMQERATGTYLYGKDFVRALADLD